MIRERREKRKGRDAPVLIAMLAEQRRQRTAEAAKDTASAAQARIMVDPPIGAANGKSRSPAKALLARSAAKSDAPAARTKPATTSGARRRQARVGGDPEAGRRVQEEEQRRRPPEVAAVLVRRERRQARLRRRPSARRRRRGRGARGVKEGSPGRGINSQQLRRHLSRIRKAGLSPQANFPHVHGLR